MALQWWQCQWMFDKIIAKLPNKNARRVHTVCIFELNSCGLSQHRNTQWMQKENGESGKMANKVSRMMIKWIWAGPGINGGRDSTSTTTCHSYWSQNDTIAKLLTRIVLPTQFKVWQFFFKFHFHLFFYFNSFFLSLSHSLFGSVFVPFACSTLYFIYLRRTVYIVCLHCDAFAFLTW